MASIDPNNVTLKKIRDLDALGVAIPSDAGELATLRSKILFGTNRDGDSSWLSEKISAAQLRDLMGYTFPDEGILLDAPSHGQPSLNQGVPRPSYVNLSGHVAPAHNTAPSTYPQFFITEIVDADTLRIQVSGVHEVPGHPLVSGGRYYLLGNGSVTTTPPSGAKIQVFHVLSSSLIVMLSYPAITDSQSGSATIPEVVAIGDMDTAGQLYRLTQAVSLGGETVPPGIYLKESDGTVQCLNILPAI